MNESIAKGNTGEALVLLLLSKLGIEAVKNQDYSLRYDYDLLCKYKDREFTVEVKWDKYSGRSRNVAIETHNTKSDTPSGVTVSKSDIWCQILGVEKDVNIVNTQKLKNFVRDETPHRVIQSGGDNNAKLHLYKFEHILPLFKRLTLDNILLELDYNE